MPKMGGSSAFLINGTVEADCPPQGAHAPLQPTGGNISLFVLEFESEKIVEAAIPRRDREFHRSIRVQTEKGIVDEAGNK